MGRGRREEIPEKRINIKKVILVIFVFILIIVGILYFFNREKIIRTLDKEVEVIEQQDNQEEPNEEEKTVQDILDDFGGEVIEQPKSDTYYVLKDGKEYTVYADGEIVEEKVSFWNGKSTKPSIDDDEKIINILSAEEFKWIAEQVINGEKNFSGFTINIQKNLDFGARIKNDGTWEGPIWTSIVGFLDEVKKEDEKVNSEDKNKEKLKRFAGNLNGNGFSIRGICIESDKNYQGLFGYSTGVIENLTLKNSYISGNDGVGGIVGLNGGTVKKCTVINTIVNGKNSKVGGIAGINSTGATIAQSYVEKGEIKGKRYVAGIIGYMNNNSSVMDCSNTSKVTAEEYVGGISGIAFFSSLIKSSNNQGEINGNNYVAGIVGYSEAQIENVYNTKNISGNDFVGGLVGINMTTGDISKSYNKGNIKGNNNIGGIAGSNNAAISNVYNTGNLKSEGYRAGGICGQNATDSFVNNSYNIGKIEGKDSLGGVAGGNFGTIQNSYYLETILEDIESEQSKTEDELKNNMFESLGQEFIIDNDKLNNGYPILSWEKP